MSTDAGKEIVRRYLARYVSGGDEAAAAELVDEDVVFASPYTPEPVQGLDGFRQMIGALRASFPDLAIHEEATVAEGDLVASRWVASGTHTGDAFGDLEATGRGFRISGMSFYRVRHGKIVEGWVNDDNLGLLIQLGALRDGAAR